MCRRGGEYEIAAVDITESGGGVPGDFPNAMRSFMSRFFGLTVSAQQQMADAAVDLMQCAGDFKNADQQIPANSTQPEPARGPGGEPMPGITMRMDGQGNWYYTDKAGDIYMQTQGEYEVQMGDASPLGQTYSPPPGQRP